MSFRKIVLTILLLFIATLPVLAEIVNINKADMAALQQHLTGIGPVKAKAIVSYRNKIGGFKSLDDLKQVPGIGDELFRKNRDSLSLSSGASKADTTNTKSNKNNSSASKSSDSSKKTPIKTEKKS